MNRKDKEKAASSQKWHILRIRPRVSLSTAFKPVPFPLPTLKALKLGEPRALYPSPMSFLPREPADRDAALSLLTYSPLMVSERWILKPRKGEQVHPLLFVIHEFT